MIKTTFCIALLSLTVSLSAHAQTSAHADFASKAIRAYSSGNDSYLLLSGDNYDPEKKYTVIKFWKSNTQVSEAEEENLAILKENLERKNIELVSFQWKEEADLEKVMTKYNFDVEVKESGLIKLKKDNYTLNTTSGNAVIILEDGKPLSLCSGSNCETRLKVFFNIRSLN